MFNMKKLKFVKGINNIKPRLKWLMFSQVQDYKINSNYIDMLCNDKDQTATSNNKMIESMVKEMLIKEFSPDIQNLKSYDLLVDAVVHNLKKKQNATIEE